MVREYRPDTPRYKTATAMLGRGGKPQSPWLEVGGGAGEFTDVLLETGREVVFLDLDEHNVQRANERGIEAYVADLCQPLDMLASGRFTGASMLEVIEHIEKAEELLLELHRVLMPGGVLLLSTPNMGSLRDTLRSVRGVERRGEGYHRRFFTIPELAQMVSEAGFEVAETRATAPAYGLNRVVRTFSRTSERRHVDVSGPLSRALGETTFMLAMKT